MNDRLIQWREDGKHLPNFMRDFHDQKELFKAMSEYLVFPEDHPGSKISWMQAHCYTIDGFLWFMAEHGYTLQKSRAGIEFSSIEACLHDSRKDRLRRMTLILKPSSESPGGEA